jgi:hypothetical protein
MSRVPVPRHVARLVMPLVVNFAYATRPGASAHRAARNAARRRLLRLTQARHRLFGLHRTSGCLGTSRDSSCGSSSTTSPRAGSYAARLVVDYFDYATHSGASARRAVRHAARRAARHRLLRLAQVCRRLFGLHRASGCLGTSRGSSCGSSSTTPPHVAHRRLLHLALLVVDYLAYAMRPGASARRAARRQLPRLRRASGCLGTSRGLLPTTPCAATSSCGHTGSTSATPCVVTTFLAATLALLRVCRVLPQHHLPVASRRPFISTSFPN